MSDYDDDYDGDQTDERERPESTRKNDWRRKLEQDAEEGRQAKQAAEAAQAERDAAKRELAFLRAGIDLDSPQGKLFAKAYDGDPTADAVKAAAQEYGLIDAPSVPAEELAAHDRFASASAGAAAQADEDVHLSAIDKAESEADVLAALAKISPDLIDGKSKIAKWERGSQNSAVTTPLS